MSFNDFSFLKDLPRGMNFFDFTRTEIGLKIIKKYQKEININSYENIFKMCNNIKEVLDVEEVKLDEYIKLLLVVKRYEVNFKDKEFIVVDDKIEFGLFKVKHIISNSLYWNDKDRMDNRMEELRKMGMTVYVQGYDD